MPNVMLSDSVYDKLKEATTKWLPAAGSLYFGLSQIWGFPAGEEVVGSLALLTTFFGVVLGISSTNYQEHTDGNVVVERDPGTGKTVFALEYDGDPEEIPSKNRLVFDVTDPFWDSQV